jgi:hypothetical protein
MQNIFSVVQVFGRPLGPYKDIGVENCGRFSAVVREKGKNSNKSNGFGVNIVCLNSVIRFWVIKGHKII